MFNLENLFNIKDKNILITGSTKGLGKSFSKFLSSLGANVIITGRDEKKLFALADEISSDGHKVQPFVLDVQEKNLTPTLSNILNRVGKIDVLINNAAITVKEKKLSHEYSGLEWDEIMQTNLKSYWEIANAACKNMINNKIYGSIINISSIAALRVMKNNIIYNTSKLGIVSVTKSMASDYASFNIRVNAICPGLFPTDLTIPFVEGEKGKEFIQKNIPLARPGNHDELYGILLYLCSNSSSYMTGEIIHIDGGMIINNLH